MSIQAAKPRYHLLNDFGIYKSAIRRNFEDNDRGPEHDDVRKLLTERRQDYTADECRKLFGFLWTAHDDCVSDNADEYSRLKVRTARAKILNGVTSIAMLDALELMETVTVPTGFTLEFDRHHRRYVEDTRAYDVYVLLDQKGQVARIANLLYCPQFCVSLEPIRNRHRSRLVMDSGVVRGLAYDRTPQGEGTLQDAVDDAVQQLARIREFLGEL